MHRKVTNYRLWKSWLYINQLGGTRHLHRQNFHLETVSQEYLKLLVFSGKGNLLPCLISSCGFLHYQGCISVFQEVW